MSRMDVRDYIEANALQIELPDGYVVKRQKKTWAVYRNGKVEQKAFRFLAYALMFIDDIKAAPKVS